MMPTEDALSIRQELGKRFGLPLWQVTMTATKANRYVIRICRSLTVGRAMTSFVSSVIDSLSELNGFLRADESFVLKSFGDR